MRGFLHLGLVAAALGAAVPAVAATSYSQYDESAASALARYVRALQSNSSDFQSLIGAGRAALELGDTQAAAGFFARADEANPRSPLPQLGMGAVSVANGEPNAAMPYFARAQQLGATQAMLGCDRGLAYDLLGQQAQAQYDYRAALNGPNADETRRRLALSLAISGDKAGAIAAIAPLSSKGDASSIRVRAFVLALTGDQASAMQAVNSVMPGSWASIAPFVQRLPALADGQKAAAVNLGIFPDAGSTSYAAVQTPSRPSTMAVSQAVTTDRLAGIDALLRVPPPAAAQPVYNVPAPTYASAPVVAQAVAPQYSPPKLWLQLGAGDPQTLSRRFAQLKSRNGDILEGIPGYVAETSAGTRLVIGPFRGPSDARILAEDLQQAGLSASSWTNSTSDRIVPLATQ